MFNELWVNLFYLAKVIVCFSFVFVYLPRKVTKNTTVSYQDNKVKIVVIFFVAIILITQLLAMLKMLETISLFVCISIFSIKYHLHLKKIDLRDFLTKKSISLHLKVFSFLELRNILNFIINYTLSSIKGLKIKKSLVHRLGRHTPYIIPFLIIAVLFILQNPYLITPEAFQQVLDIKRVSLGELSHVNKLSMGSYFIFNFFSSLLNLDVETFFPYIFILISFLNIFTLNLACDQIFKREDFIFKILALFFISVLSYSKLSGVSDLSAVNDLLICSFAFLIGVLYICNSTKEKAFGLYDSPLILSIAIISFFNLKLTLIFLLVAFVIRNINFSKVCVVHMKRFLLSMGVGLTPALLLIFCRVIFFQQSISTLIASEFSWVTNSEGKLFSGEFNLFYASYITTFLLFLMQKTTRAFKDIITVNNIVKFNLTYCSLLFVSEHLSYSIISNKEVQLISICLSALIFSIFCLQVLVEVKNRFTIELKPKLVNLSIYSLILALTLHLGPSYTFATGNQSNNNKVKIIQKIKAINLNHSWTVVSSESFLPLIYGYGFFMDQKVFLEKFNVNTYKWDPYNPEATVGTNYLYFIIDKLKLERNMKESNLIERWILSYEMINERMSVFYEDSDFVVLQVYRSAEEEKRIKREMYYKKIKGEL